MVDPQRYFFTWACWAVILRRLVMASLLVPFGVRAMGMSNDPADVIPVYVRVALVDSSPHAGAPLWVRVTLENRLPVAIVWSTYSLTPNSWNGESLNVNLLESHRAGTPGSLFLAPPLIAPPPVLQGPSRHTIVPGGSLSLTIALQKWRIVGGWRGGEYRVVLEVRNLIAGDGRVRLAISSDTLAFTLAP